MARQEIRGQRRDPQTETATLDSIQPLYPLSGLPDTQENYHIVTIEISKAGVKTRLSLSQDNNASEQERKHSEKNWNMMLATLKKLFSE